MMSMRPIKYNKNVIDFTAILFKNIYKLPNEAVFSSCKVLYIKDCDPLCVNFITPLIFPKLKYVSTHPELEMKTLINLDMLMLQQNMKFIDYKTIQNYTFIPEYDGIFKGLRK